MPRRPPRLFDLTAEEHRALVARLKAKLEEIAERQHVMTTEQLLDRLASQKAGDDGD